MTKIVSVVLILTMMTSLYAASAMAQGTARFITDSIQRYGADLAARLRTINRTGPALIEPKMAILRQMVARQAAYLVPQSAKALAAELPSMAWPVTACLSGGNGTMNIDRTGPWEPPRLHPAVSASRQATSVRIGHSQTKSIPRIRGQDGAINSPDAPDDS